MKTEHQDLNLSEESKTRRIRRDRHDRPKRSRSPEEIKQAVSETVAKGVAVITGAVEGIANELGKSDISGTATEVVRTAGRTAREVSTTAKRQVLKTKKALAEEDGSDHGEEQGQQWKDRSGGSSLYPGSGGSSGPEQSF